MMAARQLRRATFSGDQSMLKKILTVCALLYAGATLAAVDANQASAAELDSIKGIGPGLSGKILDERKKAPFKDWNDLIARVNGVGATSAAKYSTQGLTVNGSAFSGAAAAPAKAGKAAEGMKPAPAATSTSEPMKEAGAAKK